MLVYLLAPLATPAQSKPEPPAATARSSPVLTGEVAPDFTLEDQNRKEITLSKEIKNGPVVVVFYRGYW